MNKYKGWIIAGSVVLFLCVVLGSVYGYINGVRNDGLDWETRLTAQYLDNQNYLSTYISGFYEQVGVAQAQSDVLDQILTDAVKGRYDGEGGGFAIDSPMFAAIVEAYPEAGVAELMVNWGKIQDYISAGREGYRNQQSKLLDMLRVYDLWRTEGLVKSSIVRMLGFPSEMRRAQIGEMVFTGEYARQKMYQIMLTTQALEADESGTMDPLTVPDPNKP